MKLGDRYQIISYLNILKIQSAGIAYSSRIFNQKDSKNYEELNEIKRMRNYLTLFIFDNFVISLLTSINTTFPSSHRKKNQKRKL